ncbi:MAG TPA: ATP phosphoribosyltransferase regulatory subunit, partial [Candidatus Levybacteria bacterium]|nr:ATP phosphoribosyltransferase regulatory subunit [Candidatus Levybacteria bacterium]
MQNVWRAENTQKGRFREFMQCDIDTVGTTNLLADAEILAIVAKSYQQLGFSNYKIVINDRQIFAGLDTKAITIIDKLQKIGEDAVIAELAKINVTKEQFEAVKNADIPQNLQEIIEVAQTLGVSEKILQFDPTLARGLDYYTGLIFEVVSDDYPVGSLCSGGRYDKLVGMFSTNDIPAVGCAFGFDRTIEAMDSLSLFPAGLSTTKILVTIFSKDLAKTSLEVSTQLREKGIQTELYLDPTAKMDKQLKYADKKNIPYVAIIGPDEAKDNTITLKTMATREQKTISIDTLVSNL